MFARHGGITEAHDSRADLVDVSKHAQHTDLNTTNRHYIVPSVETSQRVASARVAHRIRNRGSKGDLEPEGLSAWYSRVDSSHRPPDPESVSSC